MQDFDACGALRRIRRLADLSQRELAAQLHVSKSIVGAIERGARGIDVVLLARAAALAGLRVALLREDGQEIAPMADAGVRDSGGRRFPAHLDTRRSDDGPWLHEPRRDRPETAFTFRRDRRLRDARRETDGIPDDHHPITPGDSPWERARERRSAFLAAQAREREGRFLAGEFAHVRENFTCTCPAACDDLDDRSGKPVHAPACRCDCDIA